ncbi:hypothetical protein BDM02DRAFT_3115168 [Thelephora ganbajun]|uniref:Uncharacterized protein n=1 Tax=Thelephora ganbajun TaxID=370292 RepID=A0ACB6ZG84_THEGA|nr:hypothetical protein BDM02DRAFT_3115168 [Thelephora ganbajun]
MRPGVAILSLFFYILAASATLHRRRTSAHGISHLHQLSLPFFDHLSWLLPVIPDDTHSSPHATSSTKPVVAQ